MKALIATTIFFLLDAIKKYEIQYLIENKLILNVLIIY